MVTNPSLIAEFNGVSRCPCKREQARENGRAAGEGVRWGERRRAGLVFAHTSVATHAPRVLPHIHTRVLPHTSVGAPDALVHLGDVLVRGFHLLTLGLEGHVAFHPDFLGRCHELDGPV